MKCYLLKTMKATMAILISTTNRATKPTASPTFVGAEYRDVAVKSGSVSDFNTFYQ